MRGFGLMAAAGALLALLGLAAPAHAQVITGGLRGVVTDPAGNPVAGATVVLANQANGTTDETTTNSVGAYVFSGKQPGGPYQVTVTAAAFEAYKSDPFTIKLGKLEELGVQLRKSSVEEITVTGKPIARNVGGRAAFDVNQVANTPTISRDPKDIIKLTPDAYIDSLNSSAISIGGNNNRYNSFTIDGVRQDDDFGLNGGGYPTQRSPISLAAIQEIAIEQSPFDVRYSRFLGGNVNIVTKSGTNDYHASAFYNYTDGNFTGSKTGEDKVQFDTREMQYGLAASGPILKDKLHFFANLEGFSGNTPYDWGTMDSTAARKVDQVSTADVERARQIARDVYGFDAGVATKPIDQLDLKAFVKLDWAASDTQRVTATFQRSGGNKINQARPDDTLLPLTSNWYDKVETLYTGTLRLHSNWSSQLNTQVELGMKSVSTDQNALNGRHFMQASIDTPEGGTIRLGPDYSRQVNDLSNQLYQAKASGDYLLGDHLLTGGAEYERLQVYNLFVQRAYGDVQYDSLDDFAAKIPSQIRYNNAVSGNPEDAAADWWYGIASVYLQDEADITPDLSAQVGVRYEVYQADSGIRNNPLFLDRYGFSNTETINGRSVIMPRAGLTYSPIAGLTLRGGFGLYSGGTPSVWVSNNYTNDGVTIDNYTYYRPDVPSATDPAYGDGYDGRNIPQALQNELEAGTGQVNALDPKFHIPSSWKASVGSDYVFEVPFIGDLDLTVNYTYSKVRYAVMWKDLRRDFNRQVPDGHGGLEDEFPNNQPVGTLPDGRPYYDNGNGTYGPDGTSVYDNFDFNRGADLLLTNTDKGYGHVVTAGLSKRFDFGLQLYGGYAYQNIKDVSPATSSVAASNYGYAAVGLDPNNPDLATSNYERKHRFLGVVQYDFPIIGELLSSASLIMEARSGQPYSLTYGGENSRDWYYGARIFGEDYAGGSKNRNLLYVPKGDGSDVTFADATEKANFDQLVKNFGLEKYRGKIVPRNAFTSPWVNRFDLRLMQQLPTPWSDSHRARLVVDLQNVGNMLNKNWGRYDQVDFPYVAPVVLAKLVQNPDGTVKYEYSQVQTKVRDSSKTYDELASVWRVQVGLVYDL